MPVLEVSALPRADVDLGAVSAALLRAVATALDEDPRGKRVGMWRTVEAGHCAFVLCDEARAGRLSAGGSIAGA